MGEKISNVTVLSHEGKTRDTSCIIPLHFKHLYYHFRRQWWIWTVNEVAEKEISRPISERQLRHKPIHTPDHPLPPLLWESIHNPPDPLPPFPPSQRAHFTEFIHQPPVPPGMGSIQVLLMSLGTLSMSASLCAWRSSLLSLERALCVIAARCREPSGFWGDEKA